MNDVIVEAATFAAAQSDRWLFIAMLIITILCVGVLFRYFTNRIDMLGTKIDVQTSEFIGHLKAANQEMLGVLALANSAIDRNTQLFERLDRTLHREGVLKTRNSDL